VEFSEATFAWHLGSPSGLPQAQEPTTDTPDTDGPPPEPELPPPP
jgi:hypothetical protein